MSCFFVPKGINTTDQNAPQQGGEPQQKLRPQQKTVRGSGRPETPTLPETKICSTQNNFKILKPWYFLSSSIG
jgi:hypothetical protein